MRYVLPIIMLIMALVLVIFGAQNTQAVNVRFLGAETGMISLALVIVVSAIFGALLAGLFSAWFRIRYGIQNWRARRQQSSLETRKIELEKRVSTLESENETLRTTGRLGEPAKPTVDDGRPTTGDEKQVAGDKKQETTNTRGPK